MRTRKLGRNGPEVSAIGLGCMGMSDAYGPADRTESIATVHAALDAGIALLDTGDFYGMGHNELLVREALAGRRDEVFLQVKFGAQRAPDGSFVGFDARPAAVKTACAYSLKRLGTDWIDLYMPARVDPAVPVEETVGAIQDLVQAGYVRHIGLSEAGAITIRRASAVAPIAGLQIEYSLMCRTIEADILPTLRELGIGVTAYGVLARGLLSGHLGPEGFSAPGDFRAHTPRSHGEALHQNLLLVEALKKVAVGLGATPAQVAIAWALSRGEDILPVIGARRRSQLTETLGALDLDLDSTALADLEAAVPAEAVQGTRYPAMQMRMLDSERPTSH